MATNRIQDEFATETTAHNRIAGIESAPAIDAQAVPTGFVMFVPPVAMLPALVAWQHQIYRVAYAQAVAAYTPRWLREDWFSAN